MLFPKSGASHVGTAPQIRAEPPFGPKADAKKVGDSRNSTWKDKRPSFFLAPTYCVTLSQHICLSVLNLSPLKEEFVCFCELFIDE